MASTLTSATPFFSTSLSSASNKKNTSLSSTSQILLNGKRNHQQRRFKISCNANKSVETSSSTSGGKVVDRRNMLLGLGGVYGAASIAADKLALGADDSTGRPLPYPEVNTCSKDTIIETLPDGTTVPAPYNCCPPPTAIAKPYIVPPTTEKRVRPAAHLVDREYMEKYMSAIKAMRDLPDDDPRSFKNQAKIHCAYCNYGHRITDPLTGLGDIKFQVHNNWFFLPFHRWYLYFFEKIAGELIGDPTFALPYWNWDTPCGMTMPPMFTLPSSLINPREVNPLYDPLRNPAHVPCQPNDATCLEHPTTQIVLDLNYGPAGDSPLPDIQKVCNNLAFVYRQMISNGFDSESFFGKPYYLGQDVSFRQPGSCEILHNPAHGWTGMPRTTVPKTYGEDMGHFYSAGNDPIFYCHHGNVDRMWRVWLDQGEGRQNFQSQAWLDTQFFFYDEKKNPVYVTVKDCLNEEELGYCYQPMELPWLKARPMGKLKKTNVAVNSTAPTVANAFPAKLDKVVKVLVQRPKKSRSAEQKKKKREVLVLEDIEHPSDEYVKFDIFINDEDEVGDMMSKAEFAGTFSAVPHGTPGESHLMTTGLRIGLNEILDDLQAEDDEYILVTLIPKSAGDRVTIDGIKIELV